MRSLLFVPADSERKLMRGTEAGADALVLDLEDSVLPARKPAARVMLAQYLRSSSGHSQMWVRINDLTSGELLKDLSAVVPLAPKGIVLPKIRGPEDLDVVTHYLDMAEAMHDIAAGSIAVLAVCTVYVDFKDPEGCRRNSEAARFDGFTGKVAIHPDQVAVINAAFTPSVAEIAYAEQVVAAFESGVGAVSLGGKMLDIPHLKAARRTLSNVRGTPPRRDSNDAA
jgi:citrate lyase beta subunit